MCSVIPLYACLGFIPSIRDSGGFGSFVNPVEMFTVAAYYGSHVPRAHSSVLTFDRPTARRIQCLLEIDLCRAAARTAGGTVLCLVQRAFIPSRPFTLIHSCADYQQVECLPRPAARRHPLPKDGLAPQRLHSHPHRLPRAAAPAHVHRHGTRTQGREGVRGSRLRTYRGPLGIYIDCTCATPTFNRCSSLAVALKKQERQLRLKGRILAVELGVPPPATNGAARLGTLLPRVWQAIAWT
jgi:hypothetical protein